MTDRELFRLTLRALGATREGQGVEALKNQQEAIQNVIGRLEGLHRDLYDRRRVMIAQETADQRLKPHDDQYMVHLRHCYGLDDDPRPGEEGSRHTCKYGEDDICPAMLFEDPWLEYLDIEKRLKEEARINL